MFGFSSHPSGLRTLFFTEMWERFSFYGMRGILILFLTSLVQKGGLGLDDKTAAAIYGLYAASVYLASLPGGWVADRLIGARKAVFVGGILIVAGQFTLAIPSIHTFFLGLLFIVMGTGLLKPNISVMVGQLYPDGGVKQDSGFTIFYMGINLGAAIGPLLVGYLGEKVNWHWGFAAAGLGMILGLIQLKLTGHRLGEIGLRKKEDKPAQKYWNILFICLIALAILVALCMFGILKMNPISLAEKAAYIILALALAFFINAFFFAGLTPREKKRVGVIALLFVASAMFFSGFEQAGSSMNIFADRYTVRDISFLGGIMPETWFQKFNPVPASYFQSFNPVFIITLAPLMAALWPMLGRHNCNPPLIIKFAIALILLALGFLILAAGAKIVTDDTKVWPTWLICTYLVHTLGELCLSPVGLSTVSKLSPKRLVGQMMGIWFLASALGNLVAGLVAGSIGESSPAEEAATPVAIVETVQTPVVDTPAATTGSLAVTNNSVEVTTTTEPQNKEGQGMLISRQFMRIVWFALGVAALLFILSGPIRKVTKEIE